MSLIKLYYDDYEYEFGDGFYPQLNELSGYKYKQVQFEFIPERNAWKQVFDSEQKAITGLDPPYGKELLDMLNSIEIETKATSIEIETKATSIENMWNKKIHQQQHHQQPQ